MKISDKIFKVRKPRPKYKVLKEIAARWSPRFFSDEKVKDKDLQIIFEAARWAPSGHNHQPWYFYYAEKDADNHKKLFSTLNNYNQSWAKTAPVLILACAITKNKHGKSPYAFYDLGAAVISLVLQAQSLSYYCRQMALFDKEKVKKNFALEKNVEPYIIVALGKIGDYKTASQEIIDMELDPRPRKNKWYGEL